MAWIGRVYQPLQQMVPVARGRGPGGACKNSACDGARKGRARIPPKKQERADKEARGKADAFSRGEHAEGNVHSYSETSSERRNYIPMGFITSGILCSNAVRLVPNATLFHFGILTSSVHMAWMRAVCGRLKSDYRYSKDIVYNNFPWPFGQETEIRRHKAGERKQWAGISINGGNRGSECGGFDNLAEGDGFDGGNLCVDEASAEIQRIEAAAQAILEARQISELSLAELYGENMFMFPELEKAHRENDRAVMQAYGFSPNLTESEIVERLFEMYEKVAAKK